MTPESLADLHARAFTRLRPWSAQEFSNLLQSPLVFLCPGEHAFALGRAVDDEAELLTLATDPDRQRNGYGTTCLKTFEAQAIIRGANRAFLEVDSENEGALRLYQTAGFETVALRKGYYALSGGRHSDAIVMAKALTD
ncbi:GNAT family N-acetyltransferase [Rhodobacteraceae bacterium LMO-12]|nr:GNAT family N-acetyltransferase [Rhodobacteraceae bacterium LMO-JJ12]